DFMSDIFENFFGDARGRRASGGRERGADMRYNLEITLEEAFRGKTATVKIPTAVTCEICAGTGAKAGSKPRQCPTCAGHGRVRAAQGFFSIERTCPNCHGRGEVMVPTLDGSDAKVKVPEGTQSGKQFRLKGKGMPVLRARNVGDLYIQVVVETPQSLTRRQRELLQEFERESSKETHPESAGFFSRVR